MVNAEQTGVLSWGTATAPVFHEVFSEATDREATHGRAFTYLAGDALVGGLTLSVVAKIDHSVSRVWPHFKDLNEWHNADNHYYSTIVGDLEVGESFTLRLGTGAEAGPPYHYRIIRAIPEYLIVFDQPVPEEGQAEVGLGKIPAGFNSYGLDEYDGTTRVAVFMEHSSVMAIGPDVAGMTAEDVTAPWREGLLDGLRKWRDIFIPELRRVSDEDPSA